MEDIATVIVSIQSFLSEIKWNHHWFANKSKKKSLKKLHILLVCRVIALAASAVLGVRVEKSGNRSPRRQQRSTRCVLVIVALAASHSKKSLIRRSTFRDLRQILERLLISDLFLYFFIYDCG